MVNGSQTNRSNTKHELLTFTDHHGMVMLNDELIKESMMVNG